MYREIRRGKYNMRIIIEYILNMIPYMIVTLPIYFTIRVIILKQKKLKVNWYYEISLFLFVLFVVGLISQTIIPKFEFGLNGFKILKSGVHETNLIPFKVLVDTYNEVFVNENINYFLINFLGNIIMFMPIGFFIPLLWNVSNKKVIIVGFCFSVFIEFCQLFLTRGTDIDDLILNIIGVLLGLLLYRLLYKKFKDFFTKFRYI